MKIARKPVVRKRIRGRIAALLLLVLVGVSLPNNAFGAPYLWVGNNYVAASVSVSGGLISVWQGPVAIANSPNGSRLSFRDESHLTALVGGLQYTTDYWTAIKGVVHYLGSPFSNTMVGDTIFSIWKNLNGLDLIQKVYPVAFDHSGLIVISFSFRNPPGANPLTAQIQFVLDTAPTNDDSPILTSFGYDTNWVAFPNSQTNSAVPWYFLAFQKDLPNAPTFATGLIGEGLLDDRKLGSPIHLIAPDKVIVGSWPVLANPYFAWWTAPVPSGTYTGSIVSPNDDTALLLEWPGVPIVPGNTTEVVRTAYGTCQFLVCNGRALSVSYCVDSLKYFPKPVPHYWPDPFVFESDIFSDTAQFVINAGSPFTLTGGPYLTIDTPATNRSANFHSQTQNLGASIPFASVQVLDWLVDASLYKTCVGDTTTWLTLSGTTNLGPPTFASVCETPVVLPSASIDTLAPIIDNQRLSFDSIKMMAYGSLHVHDDRCSDEGLQSITFNYVGPSQAAFRVQFNQPAAPCDKRMDSISIIQLDSTIGGCFDFTFTDCAGNISYDTICFAGKTFVPADVRAPIFTLVALIDSTNAQSCSAQTDSMKVEDDSLYDKGLDSLWVVAATNMRLNGPLPPIVPRQPSAFFSVSVLDSLINGSITLAAKDMAGNIRDTTLTFCTTPDTNPPIVTITPVNHTTWLVHVTEHRPWDRGIDSIVVEGGGNFVSAPVVANTFPLWAFGSFDTAFTESIIDTFKVANFCVYATDFAHNVSTLHCVSDTTTPDIWPPNIVLTPVGPNPNNPSVINVSVNDIHFIGAQQIGWDRGVERVWFTTVSGVDTPIAFNETYGCPDSIPTFQIHEADTLHGGIPSCITINAMDCAGNFHDTTWCYYFLPDTSAPTLVATALDHNSISVQAMDDAPYDRGLASVVFSPYASNFTGGDDPNCNGSPTWGDSIIRVSTPGQSAYGILAAQDIWGAQTVSASVRAYHTSSVELHSWVQNFRFKPNDLFLSDTLPASGLIEIPIQFVPTDSFSLDRKGITKYQFSFSLSGSTGIGFGGVNQTGTSTLPGVWNVNINPPIATNANQFTITATSNGPSLAHSADSILIWLDFVALKDASTREITVDFLNDSIVYNDDDPVTLYGTYNAVAYLLAPCGTLSGSTITVVGTCSPVLSSSILPSISSIDPVYPNPSSASSTISYTVAAEGLVSLEIFDALGRQVGELVSKSETPGYYQVGFNSSNLTPGTYFARLKTVSGVYSRALVITH